MLPSSSRPGPNLHETCSPAGRQQWPRLPRLPSRPLGGLLALGVLCVQRSSYLPAHQGQPSGLGVSHLQALPAFFCLCCCQPFSAVLGNETPYILSAGSPWSCSTISNSTSRTLSYLLQGLVSDQHPYWKRTVERQQRSPALARLGRVGWEGKKDHAGLQDSSSPGVARVTSPAVMQQPCP